jgi:hypothetical protein
MASSNKSTIMIVMPVGSFVFIVSRKKFRELVKKYGKMCTETKCGSAVSDDNNTLTMCLPVVYCHDFATIDLPRIDGFSAKKTTRKLFYMPSDLKDRRIKAKLVPGAIGIVVERKLGGRVWQTLQFECHQNKGNIHSLKRGTPTINFFKTIYFNDQGFEPSTADKVITKLAVISMLKKRAERLARQFCKCYRQFCICSRQLPPQQSHSVATNFQCASYEGETCDCAMCDSTHHILDAIDRLVDDPKNVCCACDKCTESQSNTEDDNFAWDDYPWSDDDDVIITKRHRRRLSRTGSILH